MRSVSLRPELHIPICSSNPPSCVKPIKLVVASSYGKNLKNPPSKFAITLREHRTTLEHAARLPLLKHDSGIVVMGAVCVVGILAVVLSEEKALALGPEGPLVEEFWDNVRRYGLYALTVSTGALYTIFRPIAELLKNPISAIFILALFGGSIFIVSQVLSAMKIRRVEFGFFPRCSKSDQESLSNPPIYIEALKRISQFSLSLTNTTPPLLRSHSPRPQARTLSHLPGQHYRTSTTNNNNLLVLFTPPMNIVSLDLTFFSRFTLIA
ncbi:hypothetical protein D0Y65_019099 [Glycine soja]|uniref:Uncharacterized protein ycf33 n=1 Tax=Glycine soja TaxID=3848 RepID=A0A445K279_GLYSO|nr:hypothetical protein D0Y65_019099 [Glycine soja]